MYTSPTYMYMNVCQISIINIVLYIFVLASPSVISDIFSSFFLSSSSDFTSLCGKSESAQLSIFSCLASFRNLKLLLLLQCLCNEHSFPIVSHSVLRMSVPNHCQFTFFIIYWIGSNQKRQYSITRCFYFVKRNIVYR